MADTFKDCVKSLVSILYSKQVSIFIRKSKSSSKCGLNILCCFTSNKPTMMMMMIMTMTMRQWRSPANSEHAFQRSCKLAESRHREVLDFDKTCGLFSEPRNPEQQQQIAHSVVGRDNSPISSRATAAAGPHTITTMQLGDVNPVGGVCNSATGEMMMWPSSEWEDVANWK